LTQSDKIEQYQEQLQQQSQLETELQWLPLFVIWKQKSTNCVQIMTASYQKDIEELKEASKSHALPPGFTWIPRGST
jgi:hypothetical protein